MKAEKNIIGCEWCPFCEDEMDFEVDEKTWILNCKTCGRPLLLCDRCEDHSYCGQCPHERKLHSIMKKWEKGQIGKVVYWNDPHDGLRSDYCKVVGFKDYAYVLEHIFDGNQRIEAYDADLKFLTEDEQIDVFLRYFKNVCGWNGY